MNKSNGTSMQTKSILTFFYSNSFAYFELFIIYASALNEHTICNMHPICIFSTPWNLFFYANIERNQRNGYENQLRVGCVAKTTRSRDNAKTKFMKICNYYVSYMKRGYAY